MLSTALAYTFQIFLSFLRSNSCHKPSYVKISLPLEYKILYKAYSLTNYQHTINSIIKSNINLLINNILILIKLTREEHKCSVQAQHTNKS
jgi:hypothetical protein